MVIPKSFQVGGHKFKVSYDKTISSSNACGMTIFSDLLIKIDPTMEDSLIEETFIHEVIEAINYVFELELEHPKIQALGAALHQALVTSKGEL